MHEEPVAPRTGDGGEDVLRRARAVRYALEALWGDELPPGEDPVTAVLADAVVADDEAGRETGHVVTGDQLEVSALAELIALPGDARERAARLPGGLRSRVEALLVPPPTAPLLAVAEGRSTPQLAD
ncbi:hypothetical protein [Kineococcus rhizosphaerae]|uniref:Uncharacterized protein n=1 Tax=Kineococcus rhizosphaerae TaxID=559628 RepID=A0A2T0R6S4_9ACTN|nr:hypothetical protein [Kineococcus rhizosphaerae]PRY16872.1 hypothetical protein CLV37_103304 [Kineococcus rhizosphaerae]